jgi:flagellar hook-length control protein FliK
VQTSGAKPVQSLPAKEAQVINELNKTIEKAIGQLNTILQSKAGPIQNNTPVQSSSAGIPIQTLQANAKESPKQPPDVPSLIKNDESGQVKSDRKESAPAQTNVFQSGPMNKLAQLSFHQPKQAVPVNEQLLQQITDYLGKNGLQSFKNGSQQMTVRLHPDYLGEVTITLIQDKNGIMAKITAAQSMTKDLIQSQLQQLNQGLQSQQIPVNKIEVNQMVYNGQQQSAFYQQHQESDQQPSQQQSQKDQDLSDDNIPSFEEWLAGEV